MSIFNNSELKMMRMIAIVKEIEDIAFPKEHLKELNRLTPILLESMDRDGLPIESGEINIGTLDNELNTALFIFRWVVKNNTIIENLNMVINDLRVLPLNYILLRGSPRARFYLLVQTYFNEFYRFREIHSQFVKEVSTRGFIKNEDVALIRKSFHDAFKETIELRNVFVHGSPSWKGKTHFDLNFIVGSWEKGFAIKDKGTGEFHSVSDSIDNVCSPMADTLRDEGRRMSAFINGLVPMYVEMITKVVD